VARVRHPFLASHPQADLARRQMSAGGTMVAFDLVGGTGEPDPAEDRARAFRFLDALRLVDLANNLGDAKSLITHPATTTHAGLTSQARAEAGIGETTIRFSVGLEDVEDLRADLAAAFLALGVDAED
jgi:O-succinylhomoserine sulfhydrylase